MISKINEPEMPGRIIAVIANAPQMIINHSELVVSAGTNPTKKYAPTAPKIIAMILEIFRKSISLIIKIIEPAIKPKKNDQICIG